MNTAALALRQARYEMRAFWRNPAAAFFTFVFPLMFLVIFNVVFGNGTIEAPGGEINFSTFYVPAILAFSVISACYTNIAISVSFARDRGVLKRMRGTPMPALAYLGGRIMQAVAVALILVVIVIAAGVVFYGVEFPGDKLPALAVSLIVGAAAFCALGLAITAVIPNADAAPAVVNASILPLLFISNIFIPTSQAPGWLNDFASIFPIVHFAETLHGVFNPFETGSGFEAKSLAVIAAWGLAGVAVAVRYFTWQPRK
ncbi:MAG: ABC transporter permease [Dehalococcoidia bacterium]|nr:ABC transporter permease [Dehalococcoidia bacterium]